MEGALGGAASAASQHDPNAFYRLIDSRAQSALAGLVKARQRAAALIQKSYPETAREEALRALGDAVGASEPAELFSRRCDEACLEALAQRLGPVESVRHDGALATVRTLHGDELQFYRGKDGRYGLVWNTEALRRESSRAYAELDLVKQNAALYDKQRALQ